MKPNRPYSPLPPAQARRTPYTGQPKSVLPPETNISSSEIQDHTFPPEKLPAGRLKPHNTVLNYTVCKTQKT